MKYYFTGIIISMLFGCSQASSDYLELKSRYDSVNTELNLLTAQKAEIEYLKNNSEVSIPNTQIRKLSYEKNGEEYIIKIKLPRGYYENTDKSYPVLYVTDAETNFGGISYIIQRLIKDKLIPPIIVVGIAYGTDYKTFYKLRSRDLTPIEDKTLILGNAKIPDPTGGASEFSRFLSDGLFSFIENNYRIKKNDRGIYGHSYGGLFGSYVLLKKPHLFNRYIILSPSLWYYNNYLLNEAKNTDFNISFTKIYMGSGELEGRIDVLQSDFALILKNKNIESLQIKDEILDNETHRTIFGRGFTNGLRFVYSTP